MTLCTRLPKKEKGIRQKGCWPFNTKVVWISCIKNVELVTVVAVVSIAAMPTRYFFCHMYLLPYGDTFEHGI